MTALHDVDVIYTPVRLDEFPALVSKALMNGVPHQAATVDVVALATNTWKGAQSVPVTLDWERRAAELIPACSWINHIRLGGKEVIFSALDFMTLDAFRKTDLYVELFRPLGLEIHLSVRLLLGDCAATFSIFRNLPFSDDERMIFKSLQPHISRAYLLNELRVRLSEELPTETADGALDGLTAREREILSWIAAGKRDSEIAIILGISTRTVHKHVSNVLQKLGVETRTAAAALCHSAGRDGNLSPEEILAGLTGPTGQVLFRPLPPKEGSEAPKRGLCP